MRKYILLFVIAASFFCFQTQAQDNDTPLPDENDFFVPESWESNLDSLMNSFYVKRYTHKRENPGYQDQTPANDSVYISRLSKLNTLVELPYNAIIRGCINGYVERRRSSVEYMLGLEDFYFPMIEQALDENGLPDELKYLAVIESALNPTALSRVGASGLWQFMLPTGKEYGLEINSLVDERRDPMKATYAACRYFKDMYQVFNDWTLVIASYNCGRGNVQKAIRRANGSTDYWKIYPFLPKETRMYVPLFVAATYAMNYYAQHRLYPVQTDLPPAVDTVMVNKQLHFDQISAVLGIEKDFLRALNPQYKKDIIPGNSEPRALKLPTMKVYAFIDLEDSIAQFKADEYFTNRTYTDESARDNIEKVVHVVKSGESLVSIANKYGVTASNVRKWNRLKSNKVAAGRRLTIYADNGGYSISASATGSQSSKDANVINKPFGAYKVKPDDTLASISQKFNCTQAEVKQMNPKLKLKVGQYIRIPLKEK